MLRFFENNNTMLEGNAIVYGTCASGKTEQFIKPNILAISKLNDANMVIFDAKCNLHHQLSTIIKNNGYQCIVVDSIDSFNIQKEKILKAYCDKRLCVFIEGNEAFCCNDFFPMKITNDLLELGKSIPTYFFFDEFQFDTFVIYMNSHIDDFNKQKIYYVICLQSFQSPKGISYDKFNVLFLEYPKNFYDEKIFEKYFMKRLDKSNALLIYNDDSSINYIISTRLSRVVECSLKKIRIEKGFSQEELSKLSGVSKRNIEEYEQNPEKINCASCENVFKLAKVLGCTVENLLVS